MNLEDAEKLALNCLKQGMEEKIAKNLVYLTSIPLDTKELVERDQEYIDTLLKALPEFN